MANQFVSNSTVTYDVALDGTTTVTHEISLQNKTSDFYAASYTLNLTGISPLDPVAQEGNDMIPVKVTHNNGTTSIEVDFSDAVVGEGSTRDFTISFQDKTLVNKTGEIWEITAPKLADTNSFDYYSTVLKIPNSFGQLAYISPNPSFKDSRNGKMIFGFDKDSSIKSTVTAAFGNFQVFSFDLTYPLENTLNETADIDIAIPPDTSYQKMNYTKVTPIPQKVVVDRDGNWIATFQLKPHEKVDVKLSGAVQLFASPLSTPKINSRAVMDDLNPTDLWQINDPKIKTLAAKLKTPQAIYDYVSNNLTYDYAKVSQDVQRLGAVGALDNPKLAICTEFTDLFVALARAAGIPAREIEGYAYTDNPQIQPLSLVADVLHAWPEYWDSTKQIWIPVDPTWGSTSGIDYFSKLDLKHFVFAIHGEDARKPYPAGSYKQGTNPQKDVLVSFGNLPLNRAGNLVVQNKILSEIPFTDEIVDTTITNNGPTALYDEDFKIMFDNTKVFADKNISVIPPFGSYETNIAIPYSFLGQKTPAKVQLLLNDSMKSEIGTYKNYLTISNLLMMFLFIFFIVMLIYLKFRDIKRIFPYGKTKEHTV